MSRVLSLILRARDEASGEIGKVKGALGKMGGAATAAGKLVVAGAAAGAAALGAMAIAGAGSLMRIERIGAQTDAAIKSTGGAANVTRAQIDKLSTSLEDLTATEAETIREGANLMLTFTGIRNEAGKGNDIFDQSIKTMTNMSRAMGTDMRSTAMQLGKALNDPIRGVTALRRAGVQLTAEQEESIKTMVEQGNIMGAQRVILAELETQFGGSAEAFGKTHEGMLARMGDAWGDLQETLGAVIMPLVGEVLPLVTDGLRGVADWVSEHMPAIRETIGEAMGGVAEQFGGVAEQVLPALGKALDFIRETVIPAFGAAFAWIRDNIMPSIERIFRVATEQILPALGRAFAGVQGWIADNWPQISRIVGKVAEAIRVAFEKIAEFVEWLWPHVIRIAEVLFPVIGDAAKVALDIIEGVFGAFEAAAIELEKHLGPTFDAIAGIVSNSLGVVVGWINDAIAAARTLLEWLGIIKREEEDVAGRAAPGRRPAHDPRPFVVPAAPVGGLAVPRFAGGVRDFEGGLAVVGERGPELLRLPRHTDVHSAAATRGMGNVTISIGQITFAPAHMSATEGEARSFARQLWTYLEDEAFRRGRSLAPVRGGS